MFEKGTSLVMIYDEAVPCSARRDTGPISGPRAHDGQFLRPKGRYFTIQLHSMAFGAFFGLVGLLTTTMDKAFTDGCINEGSNTAFQDGTDGINDGSDTASGRRSD